MGTRSRYKRLRIFIYYISGIPTTPMLVVNSGKQTIVHEGWNLHKRPSKKFIFRLIGKHYIYTPYSIFKEDVIWRKW